MNTATGNQNKYPPWSTSVLIAVLLIVAWLTFQHLAPPEPRFEIPYSQFKQLIREGQVENLQLQGDLVVVVHPVSGYERVLSPVEVV